MNLKKSLLLPIGKGTFFSNSNLFLLINFFTSFSYRKFYLKDGVGMVVRCKYDAVMPPSEPKGEPDTFINIRALNEWDPKVYLTGTHTHTHTHILTSFLSPCSILVETMLIGGRPRSSERSSVCY